MIPHDIDRRAKFIACWAAWTLAKAVKLHCERRDENAPPPTVFPTDRLSEAISGEWKWFQSGILR